MSGCINMSPYKLSIKTNIINDEDEQQHHHHHSITPNTTSLSSIRRAMSSADMSSPKWLQNNDFPLKRVHSSDKLQQMKEDVIDKKDGLGGAAFEDIWSSILSQKNPGSGDPVPAPYVHPLVKRASSLSEKSLEICTESLGSETGSDGFSYPSSDRGDEHEVDEVNGVEEEVKNDFVVEVIKVNYPISNKKKISGGGGNNNVGVVKSFPPPLPSLADRDDGSNLQIRTRREDGKVVVEAVSVPSKNCFRARREDGRLLLTLTNDIDDDDDEGLFDDDDGADNDDGAENEINIVGENNVDKKLTLMKEENPCFPTTRVINVQTPYPAMIMTKLMELTSNKNVSTWPRGFNRTVTISLEKGDEDEPVGKQTEVRGGKGGAARQKKNAVQSLPPRPASRVSTTTASAADVLNAYEYYWRRSNSASAAAVAVLKPLAGKQNNTVSPQVVKDNNRINKLLFGHNLKGAITQNEVVLVKAAAVGGEYLVPILRGCKEPRRSLFFLEPFCIATS